MAGGGPGAVAPPLPGLLVAARARPRRRAHHQGPTTASCVAVQARSPTFSDANSANEMYRVSVGRSEEYERKEGGAETCSRGSLTGRGASWSWTRRRPG